jgi:Xaa-Pro aminopeptidase
VDPLLKDDLHRARRVTPEERARQAFEMMRAGYRLKLAALRARFPGETAEQVDARFRRWLAREDD